MTLKTLRECKIHGLYFAKTVDMIDARDSPSIADKQPVNCNTIVFKS